MSDLIGFADLGAINAVLFDLDGTLMDSESLTDCAIKHLLQEQQIDAELDLVEFHGINWQSVSERLVQHFPALAQLDVSNWLEEHCAQLIQRQAPALIPGSVQAFLGASAQMPVAIVTGSNAATVEAYLERAELQAAEQLNLSPETCLVFEDSIAGLHAAAAAGMPTIAIAHSAGVPPISLAPYCISDYTSLPDDFFHRLHQT